MKARLIIDRACSRDCSYCCNKHPNTQPIKVTLEQYIKQIVPHAESHTITGGEPCLKKPQQILDIIRAIRHNSTAPIFLYTQLYNQTFRSIIDFFDGFTYTLHFPVQLDDIVNYIDMQKFIKDKKMSKRLVINHDINDYILVEPKAWTNVKVIEFIQDGNCPLPKDEVLFELIQE